jgi:hypothetical protein
MGPTQPALAPTAGDGERGVARFPASWWHAGAGRGIAASDVHTGDSPLVVAMVIGFGAERRKKPAGASDSGMSRSAGAFLCEG